MVGVALLSMMKLPSWNMIEFKGLFPTMDQARIISTTTFASRMAAADDKNELAEATTRDIIPLSLFQMTRVKHGLLRSLFLVH